MSGIHPAMLRPINRGDQIRAEDYGRGELGELRLGAVLSCLPAGAVVQDRDGWQWEHGGSGWWHYVHHDTAEDSMTIAGYGPLFVLQVEGDE